MARLSEKDRQLELARQNRLLARADRRFGREFEIVLSSGSEQMLDQYKRTGSAPDLPIDFYRRVEAVYVDLAGVVTEAFGARVLDQGKTLGYDFEVKNVFENFAAFFQQMALDYIAQEAIRQRIASVTNTTRDIIVNLITQGQKAGDSVDDIADRIASRIPVISRWRGAMIARTETHGAANYGAQQAGKATGLPLKKEWISAEDHRTRDFGQGDGVVDEFDHRSANGQIVDLDQPFRIASRNGAFEEIMFPGDPSGSAGNVINCRCASARFVEGF